MTDRNVFETQKQLYKEFTANRVELDRYRDKVKLHKSLNDYLAEALSEIQAKIDRWK